MSKFKLYKTKPNAISSGRLYTIDLKVPFHDEKRSIRVWVPEHYKKNDPYTRYPVIYMCDGQNLVDRYTSAYGEWNLDEVEEYLENKGYPPFIIVGIDCPKEVIKRSNELSMPGKFKNFKDAPNNPIGDDYLNFMFNVVKPMVDEEFNTNPSRETTGIGGSSMGGLMAFYGFAKIPDVIGFSLCFSPAFFIYYKDEFLLKLHEWMPNHNKYGKIYFYVGGKDFEHMFSKSTYDVYKYMVKCGFKSNQINFVYDANAIHHEEAWHEHSYDAFKFWLK